MIDEKEASKPTRLSRIERGTASPHQPVKEGVWGGHSTDSRRVLNGALWVLWQEYPGETCRQGRDIDTRFGCWRVKGVGVILLQKRVSDPGGEWCMIDAHHGTVSFTRGGCKRWPSRDRVP